MINLFLFFAAITIFASHQKVYFSLLGFLFLVSFGKLFTFLTNIQSMSIIYIYYFAIFFISIMYRERDNYKLTTLIFVIGVFCLLLMQTLVSKIDISGLSLGIARFLFLPIMASYAAKDIIKRNVDLCSIFIVYFSLSFVIFYIRAFYSYDFFNILDVEMEAWTYRPSSFTNPIIFAIEVAIFISLMLHSQLAIKAKLLLILISIIPLVLMFSRSAYVIIIINLLFFLIYKKRFVSIFNLVFVSTLLGAIYFNLTGDLPYILSIFDFEGGSYGTRTTSMTDALIFISEMNIQEFLFGLGSGFASQHGATEYGTVFYVENTFLSLIIENGMLFMVFYLISLIYFIIKTGLKKNSKYHFVLIISIALVNLFSANLTVLSVQILYWAVYFYSLNRSIEESTKKI